MAQTDHSKSARGVLRGLHFEETLRLRPPFTRVERVPTRQVEIAGEVIEPNTLVHLWLLSANHDERVFEGPRLSCRSGPTPGRRRSVTASTTAPVLRSPVWRAASCWT
ncbi:cytochrome P450 [Streptomyces tubercidicus]|uniref:cytochrome P450 n=1 Tax=Streptomyces tubercidicus TaxID=47759 RepID=UPI0036CD08B9